MARIVVSSDYHLDWLTGGVDRFVDVSRAADKVVDFAIREKADGFFFLGDLTDPDNPRAFRAVAFAIRLEARLRKVGIPSIWLAGNHDVIEDGTGATTLDPLKAAGGRVFTSPVAGIRNGAGRPIVCLPFTPLSHNYSPVEFIESVELDEDPLVIGHLNLEGISAGSETKDFARGRNVFFPIDEVKKKWPKALMMNGHYHERQTFRDVVIPGSLARLTHSEEKNDPGFLVVDL